ncbi:MAG: ATP-binding protein [Oscillatoriaceae bacterium SKW80]|nr:ATP-binding protein [Oscillatoriaceae bacterium SKYG93]MCX8119365.1 ATP-binding protein [Oscillatoriaceae bacterium SKW80]MDW8454832.1 ATP-binding protein [Oscillatoriaceae cyanobacterium SKYGB_i_bin93]
MSVKEKKAIEINIKFELLSERLKRIMLTAETQNTQAKAALEQAEVLRIGFTVVSILLSTAIAIAIGFYTTRAITHPILSLSKVAQQITEQSNFNLTAPVFSKDEVGLLANSINQLVTWVKKYIQELELARYNLEQRVEERTQELNRKIQELKQTQAQLIQSEKMSSLGQLVAGIAHEINNPISFIYGNVQYANQYIEDLLDLLKLYQHYYPAPEKEIQEKIEEIEIEFLLEDLPRLLYSIKIGAERIRKIVLSLRNFSRLDESELKTVDIREGIENTLLILNSRFNQNINNIKVIKNYGEIPLLECYPAELNQVFMNLITNAIDALEYSDNRNGEKTEKKPTIVISVQKIDSDRVRIAIWNNGPAIPAEIIDKIFDPFFTTKPVGKGTGLGLYICYQIIEKHGGKIEVSSDSKQGTEFAVVLPVKQKITY